MVTRMIMENKYKKTTKRLKLRKKTMIKKVDTPLPISTPAGRNGKNILLRIYYTFSLLVAKQPIFS